MLKGAAKYEQRTKWKNTIATQTYYAWRSMRARCSNPKNASWEHYGGRGITVCDEWQESYDVFFRDMGQAPAGLQLDRIDNEKGYCKDNCRWVTSKANLANRRVTVRVKGELLEDAAQRLGLKTDTLRARLARRSRSVDECLVSQNLGAPSPAEHGTRKKYERDGCRCRECKAFNTQRAAVRRQMLSKQLKEVQ